MSMSRSPLHYAHLCYRSHRRLATDSLPKVHATHQTRSIISSVKAATTTTHRHTHKSILKRIHPQHLYQIINDVDRYQDFLPYCQESRVLQRSPCGTMYDAVLRVGLPGLSNDSSTSSSLLEERYVSRVRMTSPLDVGTDTSDDSDGDAITSIWSVEAKSIQSQLFDSLKSRWRLALIDNSKEDVKTELRDSDTTNTNHASCSVNFEVEIQVSNPLISFTLDRVLEDVARKQIEAFERRCNDVPFTKR